LFLANLDLDETESTNLAAEHPKIVEELASMQRRFAESIQNDAAR
jgi:hypothetical protein